jgi:hypothetical protein
MVPGKNDDTKGDVPRADDDEEEEEPSFCTLAVTGNQPQFQAIFICNECFHEELVVTNHTGEAQDASSNISQQQQQESSASSRTQMAPLCICQACADICHNDDFHDVEYVGMGPATCDCNHLGGCKIHEASSREAERLGIQRTLTAAGQVGDNEGHKGDDNPPPASMIKEVFEIPFLQDTSTASMLAQEAQELIRHTKETHWVDERLVSNGTKLCSLESLAWSIYQSHRKRYETILHDCGDNHDGTEGGGGAEWWVQVKDISMVSAAKSSSSSREDCTASSIELHYDKDEALAESFGLGSFPTFSTVTYLTPSSQYAAPTVVFDHVYTQGEEEVMSQMLVSRPRLGKHVIFDGRLLHGAPFHRMLQATVDSSGDAEKESATTADDSGSTSAESSTPEEGACEEKVPQFRITFLVNIWKDRRPSNVKVLDNKIRNYVFQHQGDEDNNSATTPSSSLRIENPLTMNSQTLPQFVLENEGNLPKELQQRIELPFVSDKALGDDDKYDKGVGSDLVVVTFPPPPFDDNILVAFAGGMQAYLDYVQQEEDGSVGNTTTEFQPSCQSDYV